MIVLRDKYEGVFLHSYSQEVLRLLKEHEKEFFNKYFIEE